MKENVEAVNYVLVAMEFQRDEVKKDKDADRVQVKIDHNPAIAAPPPFEVCSLIRNL